MEIIAESPDSGTAVSHGVCDDCMRTIVNDDGTSLQSVIGVWAATDPARAAAALAAAPDLGQETGAYSTLAMQWAGKDVQAALGWAQGLAEGQGRQQAFAMIVSRWSQQDLGAARDWAFGLPAGPVRDQALPTITAQWANQDPRAAAM